MRNLAIALAALFLASCAGAPTAGRRPSSFNATEQVVYREGLEDLQLAFAKFNPSHPKHRPTVLTQGGPTSYVVVLMHGLNESPWYLKSLARHLQGRGYNVVLPFLAKHWAKPANEMHKADFREWLADFQEAAIAAHKLGRKVLLAGHSTGGALAVHTCVNQPQLCDGLLLWSPAVALSYKTYYGAFIGWLGSGLYEADWNKLAGKPPFDDEHVSFYSPVAGREVYRLGLDIAEEFARNVAFRDRKFWNVRASAYGSITVPVFTVEPAEDKVVHKPEVDYMMSSVSGPKDYFVQAGEQHNSVSKDEGDYVAPVQRANHDYKGMIERLDAFLDQHFPNQ